MYTTSRIVRKYQRILNNTTAQFSKIVFIIIRIENILDTKNRFLDGLKDIKVEEVLARIGVF